MEGRMPFPVLSSEIFSLCSETYLQHQWQGRRSLPAAGKNLIILMLISLSYWPMIVASFLLLRLTTLASKRSHILWHSTLTKPADEFNLQPKLNWMQLVAEVMMGGLTTMVELLQISIMWAEAFMLAQWAMHSLRWRPRSSSLSHTLQEYSAYKERNE